MKPHITPVVEPLGIWYFAGPHSHTGPSGQRPIKCRDRPGPAFFRVATDVFKLSASPKLKVFVDFAGQDLHVRRQRKEDVSGVCNLLHAHAGLDSQQGVLQVSQIWASAAQVEDVLRHLRGGTPRPRKAPRARLVSRSSCGLQ